MSNTLYLIRGLPGSGKSSFANKLWVSDMVEAVFEADKYFYNDGIYTFDPAKLHRAHQWCLEHTRWHLERGYNIAVSNTFTTEKELQPYLKMAEELNCKCFVMIVENRHGNKSIHDVPQETIEKMKNRFSIKL